MNRKFPIKMVRKQCLALPHKWTYDAKNVHYSVTLKLKAYLERLCMEVSAEATEEELWQYQIWLGEALEIEAERIITEQRAEFNKEENQKAWEEEKRKRSEFDFKIIQMQREEEQRRKNWNRQRETI